MKFSYESSSVEEFTSCVEGLEEVLDESFEKFQNNILELSAKLNYKKLFKAFTGIVDLYNISICKEMRANLLELWEDSGESMLTYAEDLETGDETEDVAVKIEAVILDIFATNKKNDFDDAHITGESNVSEEDFQYIQDIFKTYADDVQEAIGKYKTIFEENSEENDIYMLFIPLVEAIATGMSEFIEESQKKFSELKEDFIDVMKRQETKTLEAKEEKLNTEFDFDLPIFSGSTGGTGLQRMMGGSVDALNVKNVTHQRGDLNQAIPFKSKIREKEAYTSKFEYDMQQKVEDYYRLNEGKLTDVEKREVVAEIKRLYDKTDKSERGDVLIPENSKDVTCIYYNNTIGRYDFGYDWKPIDTVPKTRHMEVLVEGKQFDRVGRASGRCTGVVGEDGSCATKEERSIPYHLTEKDITQEPSYHRYEVEQMFTKENLYNAIDNSMYDDGKKADMYDALNLYYERMKKNGYGDGDGVASGEIAPMFENTTGGTGGGNQYDMPFSMEELENIGMISEVPRDWYGKVI